MSFILPEVPKRQTTAQKLSSGLGHGLNIAQQLVGQQQQREAMSKLGIDPNVLSLPEQGQAAFFKHHFAQPKEMTLLQQSQKALADERLKALQSNQNLFGSIFNQQQGQSKGENQTQSGFDLSQVPEEKLREAAAFKGQPGEMGILGNIAQGELDRQEGERKSRSKKEGEYFKFNEPKLAELATTAQNLQMEDARFSRLENLFQDHSKFPSTITAALFSKDGQLRDVAYSQLTPEAQEAIKLIIDSTSNIKDTYGARVTNFDLQTYLKKLPSLFNSPEGKMRVLRDLRIMNQLNRLHAEGIQDIFEEAGGSDKIPYSKAEKLYKKKFGPLEKQLVEQFVSTDKGIFNEKPDAAKHLGRKIKDSETGEIYISNGTEWTPFKG